MVPGDEEEPVVLIFGALDGVLFTYRFVGFVVNAVGVLLLVSVYQGERDKVRNNEHP